jgi:hypothetical protein
MVPASLKSRRKPFSTEMDRFTWESAKSSSMGANSAGQDDPARTTLALAEIA